MTLPLLPPLNALRAFKVASLSGSFSAAAAELCVSQGAVSRHIAKLEDYLGVRLFDRTNREVRLTPVGADYAEKLQAAFEAIELATVELHTERKRDHLKVGVYPSLANTWVMGKLEEYQEAHSELSLELVCQTTFSDIEAHALDIMGMNSLILVQHSGIEYLPMMDVVLSPICTREMSERIGKDPANLPNFATLHSLRRPEHWQQWFEAAGLSHRACRASRHFENSALAHQAAVTGMGVAMGLTSIENHLPVYQRMVHPFALKIEKDESYGFGWRQGALKSEPAREFITWMDEQKSARDDAQRVKTAH